MAATSTSSAAMDVANTMVSCFNMSLAMTVIVLFAPPGGAIYGTSENTQSGGLCSRSGGGQQLQLGLLDTGI